MRTILITVGTSLLNNAKRNLQSEQPNEQQLANYLRHTDPVQACAETNSLSRLLQEGDRLVFLHSQTEEGQRCAEALARHYDNRGYQTDLTQVPDLTYKESRFKMRGLRALVATMIDLIRKEKRKGQEVLINATGGFKAEIAYATLVGLLFDVPVYYIHEAFRDIIEMPPTPIAWDYSLLADYEEFFEWVNTDLRPKEEVERRLRGLPPEIHLLLTEEEGYTMLSPAGEAFYQAYQDRLQQKAKTMRVLLSAAAWDQYRSAAPNVQAIFDRALQKLCLPELRASKANRVRNCDCLVFKGHRDGRLFFFEADNGSIRVCELARHSDGSYKRLIDRGVRCNEYTDFQPWQLSEDSA